MSIVISCISSRAMCSAWWTPCGLLMKEAVVWAASAGKERSFCTRKVKTGSGMKEVSAFAKIEAARGKCGNVRRGWPWLA